MAKHVAVLMAAGRPSARSALNTGRACCTGAGGAGLPGHADRRRAGHRPRPAGDPARRRLQRAARAVRRGRHHPGPARAPAHPLHAFGRARLGARHAQGPGEDRHGAAGRSGAARDRRQPARGRAASTSCRRPTWSSRSSEGSSVGVIIVREDRSHPPQELRRDDWAFGEEVLVETYVAGRELTCAVMGDRALGVIDIRPATGVFYDYDAKYAKGGSIHVLPAEIKPNIYQQVQELALTAHQALGCRGVSRADLQIRRYARWNGRARCPGGQHATRHDRATSWCPKWRPMRAIRSASLCNGWWRTRPEPLTAYQAGFVGRAVHRRKRSIPPARLAVRFFASLDPRPATHSVAVPLARRMPRFRGTGLTLGFFGVVTLRAALGRAAISTTSSSSTASRIDALARLAGLGLEKVTISGIGAAARERGAAAPPGSTASCRCRSSTWRHARSASRTCRSSGARRCASSIPNELAITLVEREPYRALAARTANCSSSRPTAPSSTSCRTQRFVGLPLSWASRRNTRTKRLPRDSSMRRAL